MSDPFDTLDRVFKVIGVPLRVDRENSEEDGPVAVRILSNDAEQYMEHSFDGGSPPPTRRQIADILTLAAKTLTKVADALREAD